MAKKTGKAAPKAAAKGAAPRLEIVYRKVADLIPYARNARTHDEAQVAMLAGSIREFGFTNPVLLREDGILAGHGRVMAARVAGLEEVPTVDLGHLSPTQAKAYVLADNQLALKAGWDYDMLRTELEELRDADFDLGLAGFTDADLSGLLDDWAGAPADLDKHGEHTDAIPGKITITVAAGDVDKAREAITNALQAAGIEFS